MRSISLICFVVLSQLPTLAVTHGVLQDQAKTTPLPAAPKLDVAKILQTEMGKMDTVLGKATTLHTNDTGTDVAVPPDNKFRKYEYQKLTVAVYGDDGNQDPLKKPRYVEFTFQPVKSWKDCAIAVGLKPAQASQKSIMAEGGKMTEYHWKSIPGWRVMYQKWNEKVCSLQFQKEK